MGRARRGQRPIEDGGDRHREDVGSLPHLDIYLGGHAREEGARRIVDQYHRVVGDDILDRRGIDPDLAHRPREGVVREGGDRELGGFSVLTFPTSASSTEVSTCMSVRFVASVKSVGVCREEATVWPILMLRAMMILQKDS